MSGKVGRNELCPCGSGKKHKKCCLPPSGGWSNVADFEWRHLRQLEGSVVDGHLTPYVKELSPLMVEHALLDALPGDLPEALDGELLFNQFFLPWYLFDWIGDGDTYGVKSFDPSLTIAQNYLKYQGETLKTPERRFLEAMGETY